MQKRPESGRQIAPFDLGHEFERAVKRVGVTQIMGKIDQMSQGDERSPYVRDDAGVLRFDALRMTMMTGFPKS